VPPVVYVAVIVLVGLATYVYKLSADGIFACPATGYDMKSYLADCNAADYGDFDHGAFWYGLEPDAIRSARAADVLFIGSSRMQFGFSTSATEGWFRSRAKRPFLLGFSHSENAAFIGPLLEKIGPSPKALVINVDGFFRQRISPPAQAIFAGGDIRQRYTAKHRWQPVHQSLCGMVGALCGTAYAIFRDSGTGFWSRYGRLTGAQPAPIAAKSGTDVPSWPERAERARSFLSGLTVDTRCVVLTLVPSSATSSDEAAYLADALGLPLIAPAQPGLMTFDGSHLDDTSAERWSQSFFERAGTTLDSCLSAGS
jgi:hypothetical protein